MYSKRVGVVLMSSWGHAIEFYAKRRLVELFMVAGDILRMSRQSEKVVVVLVHPH